VTEVHCHVLMLQIDCATFSQASSRAFELLLILPTPTGYVKVTSRKIKYGYCRCDPAENDKYDKRMNMGGAG